MKTRNIIRTMVAACMTATIIGCSEGNTDLQYNSLIDDPQKEEPSDPSGPDEPQGPSNYDELYRPQIHYTPAKNWINDPNGLVFLDGTYHMFYQYNPEGNGWGNMSWGHATSTDLIHWEEQPVALTRDALGAVFSGSCVIDKNNTAGFGANAMVALYTSAGETGDVAGKQQQSVAYSTDGGKTFTRYANNPVIANNDDNLRDPKVFWHEATSKWVMVLAKGWARGCEFYTSADLKNWEHASTFVYDFPNRPGFQWECPDLLQMGDKWVLLLSVNPQGPLVGSGMMYFVGQFDGTTFTPDALDYPLWLDYGMDNYAGVTWSNTGNRKLMIGWMNNWSYSGDVPCSPWRSAMTLPRELQLVNINGKPVLTQTVVKEIEDIAGEWQPAGPGLDVKDAYQLRLTISLDKRSVVTLSNAAGEQFSFEISATERALIAHRTAASGKTAFNGTFSIPSMRAPLFTEDNKVTLDVFVDQSSVEIFTDDGTLSMTNLVFPSAIYNHLDIDGADSDASVRPLKRIWK
ncbi:fructan beta-fructosidase [Prevotella sp. tc2-28]|uniref:glycoside hydrolase family 32 protein n=1 Tax=Prevotella sp. tc2-28 TaxID=1761888 RepID=UPI00089A5F4B|nr:glycoside hydrolase family 32 protein [Prevotella sp. tc2-28]SEA44873.1 fructan beta-fructosidase [Prevotella sp. tc2-28]